MQNLIIFTTFLAMAAAAPVLLLDSEVHVPLGKTTITKNSQVVDHGSTYIHHPIVPVVHATPVVHAQILHAPVVHTPVVHVATPVKSTLTTSSHAVNHGSTTLVHAPIVHAPVLVHSSPVVTFKSGDSAVSHHSSTVHETVPLVAVHH